MFDSDSSSTVKSSNSSDSDEIPELNSNAFVDGKSIIINNSKCITIGNVYHYSRPLTIAQNQQMWNPTVRQYDFATDRAPNLTLVSRNGWSAREPKRPLFELELPAVNVIIAHTVNATCPVTQMDGSCMVRNIQDYHIQVRKFDDISYNFLIGGDGSIYVGRGWNYIGEHSGKFNQRSICIAFIGRFCENVPSFESLVAARQLIKVSVDTGKLVKGYRLYGHRQVLNTLSPGDELYTIIQKWEHWAKEAILP